jgi:hypothetical protein
MTKGELKDNLKDAIKHSRSFDGIINDIANYVVMNFKLKKVVIYGSRKGKRNK